MSLRVPGRSPRSPRKPPAPRPRPRPPPSNRRAVLRIWQRRSKRLPRSPKRFSTAMASRRQQIRKKADVPAAVGAGFAAEDDAASEKLLIFRIAGESFGLRLDTVAGMIPLPNLAHMPLVPPSLLGLANLRGIVLPVVSLRALLRLPEHAANEQTRVIVMRGDAAVGFVVDRVERLMSLAAGQLEQDDVGAGTTDPALLDGVIKGDEGESTIKILSPARLLAGQFAQLGVSATRAANRPSVVMAGSAAAPAQVLASLLSF